MRPSLRHLTRERTQRKPFGDFETFLTVTPRDVDPYLSSDGVGVQDGRRTFVVPAQLRGLIRAFTSRGNAAGKEAGLPGARQGPFCFCGQEDLTLYGVPKQ